MKKILLTILISAFFLRCEQQPKSYKYGIPEEEYNTILYGIINSNYTTNTNYGSVQDPSTKLEWKRCAQGQVFNSTRNNCQGTSNPTLYTPVDLKYGAKQYAYCNTASNDCNSLALVPLLNSSKTSTAASETAYASCNNDTTGSVTGWRVPTIVELQALASLGRVATIQKFPDAPDEKYWSATSEVDDLSGEIAKSVNFAPGGYGEILKIRKDTKLYLRCVRNY